MNADEIRAHLRIYHPYQLGELQRAEREKLRLAYYTDADTAMKLLASGDIWLRQTSLMNDSREVLHGLDCLRIGLELPLGKKLEQALEGIYPGICKEIGQRFWPAAFQLELGTFVACMSEHGGPDKETTRHEDQLGRLSMWRAYGRGCGVALVLHPKWLPDAVPVAAFSSAVAYLTPPGVAEQLGVLADNIVSNRGNVESRGREQTIQDMLVVFRSAAVCIKHPGFKEEREWRMVAMPSILGMNNLKTITPTIGGIPQQVQTINIGVAGRKWPEIIDRVIIGPTSAPAAVHGVLYQALAAHNIPNGPDRLILSNIPLRVIAG